MHVTSKIQTYRLEQPAGRAVNGGSCTATSHAICQSTCLIIDVLVIDLRIIDVLLFMVFLTRYVLCMFCVCLCVCLSVYSKTCSYDHLSSATTWLK